MDFVDNKLIMYTGLNTPLLITALDTVIPGTDTEYSVTKYEYNQLYQLTKMTDPLGKSEAYEYDINGNLLKKVDRNGNIITSVYDAANRVISRTTVTANGTGNVTEAYAYNNDGLRSSKTVNGIKTVHVWDGDQIVLELNASGTVTNKYVRGINLISAEDGTEANKKYYLFNGHGDVVQLTGTNGSVIKSYDYDAFGNEKNIDPNDTNVFRYCGEYFDKETGTIYLRARYYNPAIGRFISEDSYWGKNNDQLSLNLYTYCYNTPVNLIDSDGHNPLLYAIYLYITKVCTSPDTQRDIEFLAADMASGDYLAAAFDAIGILVPGGTDFGQASKPVKKLVGKLVDYISAKTGKSLDEIMEAVTKASKGVSKASSVTLRQNMIDAGMEVPDYANAAHHIIAGNDARATGLRNILQKYGIDINSAENGVFLPAEKEVSEAAYHRNLHTNAYYENVEKAFQGVSSKEEAIEVLQDIRDQLLEGTFPH